MLESSISLDEMPGANATVVVEGPARRLGGPALNIALHLASLGRRVRLAGVMGRWDEPMLRSLQSRIRIDTGDIVWLEGSTDLLFYVKTAEGFRAIYQAAAIPESILDHLVHASADTDIVIFAGSRHARLRRAFGRIAAGSTQRWKVFAPNYSIYLFTREDLLDILPNVTLICLNEGEARHVQMLLGLADFLSIQQHTTASVIVTRGPEGADIYTGREVVHIPAYSRREGDFIGAGDAFLASCVHRLLFEDDLLDSAILASKAAAAFVNADAAWPLLGEITFSEEPS